MTRQDLTVDPVLTFEVMMAFREEQACEHVAHDSDNHAHGGSAEYYAIIKCPNCGEESPLRALCEPFVTFVKHNGGLVCVTANNPCGVGSYGWTFPLLERIGN